MNKCLSKFVIISIYFMTAILMLIIIDSAYISDALAQTNPTDIGTKRTIATQKTIASGENATNVGNNLTQTNTTNVGNNQIMLNRITNNIGDVAVDKFSNIFIADSGNYTILKFDGAGKFIG
jgi:hypothetical protein